MSNSSKLGVLAAGKRRLATSPIEVEDSMLLRILVQALVAVGIIATDVAAETQNSLWAVPLSLVGATWSWRNRCRSNVPVKFCIAMGMLFALGAFFGHLLGAFNDTRLVLAGLLIQLQVLHSFDLPRRKDLGYSMVIGLILLGVAGTLSQTLGFAIVLLLFLAIALPVLVLDYRSRLGLAKLVVAQPLPIAPLGAISWRRLSLFFVAILGIGLVIFAVLPRFPGYQLKTFPVSQAIKIEGKFDGRSIINPGYVRQGDDSNVSGTTGSGSGHSTGKPGKIDNTFYYGFNSKINQNLRGEMKPKIVMRVRSQIAGFWRVLAFDRYTGTGWEISRNQNPTILKRQSWAYQFFLSVPRWLNRTQEVVQTYTVVSELPNLVPALAYPKEIYFPTPIIAIDAEGGLRSPTGLSENLTYTVISQVPYRESSRLKLASTSYPPEIQASYLQIPAQIAAKVRHRTEEILSASPNILSSTYEQTLFLAQQLKQIYSITASPLALPYLREDEDLVETFLFKSKGGYPDHFSTTLTIMLRSIGIPARLVAGFAPGNFNPFTGLYVVRNTDAYAMTEVYFPNFGWFTFDPIPGHELIPPSVEDTQTFSVIKQIWQWVAGWLPSPITGILGIIFGAIFSWIFGAIAWFLALFAQGWVGTLTALIVATIFTFLCWLSWNQWRQWSHYQRYAKLPPMESLYQRMLRWTEHQGFRKHPAQTPLEYAKVSQENYPPAIAEVIDEICQAYVNWRYGSLSPDLSKLRRKWQDTIKTQK